MTASWCDKLASTPAVGLKFDYHHAPSQSLLEAIAPIVDTWVEGEKQKFQLTQQDAFGFQLTTDDGFLYGVDPSKMFVEFKHRLKAKARSGAPPILEMLSRPAPFTELLPVVSRRLLEAASLILGMQPRNLTRVGIVSTTVVSEDEAPPGILRFIRYVGRPWAANTSTDYSFHITASLGEASGWSDRCVHTITKAEDSEGLVTIKLDWQRLFSTPKSVTGDSLKGPLDSAQDVAIKYFEDVAIGNRFDEDLINNTA